MFCYIQVGGIISVFEHDRILKASSKLSLIILPYGAENGVKLREKLNISKRIKAQKKEFVQHFGADVASLVTLIATREYRSIV